LAGFQSTVSLKGWGEGVRLAQELDSVGLETHSSTMDDKMTNNVKLRF